MVNRKKNFSIFIGILVICFALLTGCTTLHSLFYGKTSQKVQAQDNKIVAVESQISSLENNKINDVKSFSFGVDYSLQKATNKEPAVVTAQELNKRVQSLVGLPSLEEQMAMANIVENLISNNIEGQKMLAQKDTEISALQNEETFLIKQKDVEVDKAISLSKQAALEDDANKAELSKYQGHFGLNAIFLGGKQFIKDSMWVLLGGGVIFIILRVLSTSNPIAAGIFSIFNVIGGWFINCIKVLVPKALNEADVVLGSAYTSVKSALNQVVDGVETTKLIQSASGNSSTINTLLSQLDTSMSDADKNIINEIKADLNWVKPTTTSTVSLANPPLATVNTSASNITPTTTIIKN